MHIRVLNHPESVVIVEHLQCDQSEFFSVLITFNLEANSDILLYISK